MAALAMHSRFGLGNRGHHNQKCIENAEREIHDFSLQMMPKFSLDQDMTNGKYGIFFFIQPHKKRSSSISGVTGGTVITFDNRMCPGTFQAKLL